MEKKKKKRGTKVAFVQTHVWMGAKYGEGSWSVFAGMKGRVPTGKPLLGRELWLHLRIVANMHPVLRTSPRHPSPCLGQSGGGQSKPGETLWVMTNLAGR